MSGYFGTNTPAEAQAPMNLKPDRYGTNQAGKAAPVFWGMTKLACNYIAPLWGEEIQPVKKDTGKGDIVVQNNRYANFAALLCVGMVDELVEIQIGDDANPPAWSGSMLRTSADSHGKVEITIANIGVFHFYFGSATQLPDPVMTAMWADNPAYRDCCYVVGVRIFFGQSPSPPGVTFVVKRRPSSHLTGLYIGNDSNVPETLYDIFTNPIYGLALDRVNKASFDAAAVVVRAEGNGTSPDYQERTDIRQICGDLLSYIRAVIDFDDDGNFILKLNRDGDSTVAIDMSQMTDEPQIKRLGWTTTFSETNVTFTNRALNFENDRAPYDDQANLAITKVFSSTEINMPFITNWEVASALARIAGQINAVPGGTIQMQMTADMSGIRPGDRLSISYLPLSVSELIMRVENVTVGNPKTPDVSVSGRIESANVTGFHYVTPAEPYTPPVPPEPQNAIIRIGWLPDELKNDQTDGFFVCAARQNSYTSAGAIYLSMADDNYFFVASLTSYSVAATIIKWRMFNGRLLLNLSLLSIVDEGILNAVKSNFADLQFVFGLVSNNIEDPHCAWGRYPLGGRLEKIDVGVWDVELETGLYGTPAIQISNIRSGSPSHEPGNVAFGGSRFTNQNPHSDFTFETVAGTRKIKVTTQTIFGTESLIDAVEDDSTNPAPFGESVFSRPWCEYSSGDAFASDNDEYVLMVQNSSVAHWRLAGLTNEFDPAHDLTGTAAFDAASLILGDPNGAATFDASAALTATTWAGVILTSGQGVQIWFKSSDSGTGFRAIISKRGDWMIAMYDGLFGFYDFGLSYTGMGGPQVGVFRPSGAAINPGEITHLCLILTGTGSSRMGNLYVNGALALSELCTKTDDVGDIVIGLISGDAYPSVTIPAVPIVGASAVLDEASIGNPDPVISYQTGTNIWWT